MLVILASDSERNKLRKLLLSDTPFQGYLDFSRPIVAVSGEAIRKGRAAYPPQVPLKIKMAAGWPAADCITSSAISRVGSSEVGSTRGAGSRPRSGGA